MKHVRFAMPALLIAAVLAGFAGGLFAGNSASVPAGDRIAWSISDWDDQSQWTTYGSDLTFKGPNDVFWPVEGFQPQVQKTTCAAVAKLRAAKGFVQTCYGDRVCVNEEGDGAAGSSYVTYSVSVKDGANCGTAKFTIRYTSGDCAAYDSPYRETCAARQDHIRAEILPAVYSSFQFTK